MSHIKDSFDDDELTSMASEILRDLATKANDDPTVNPYLYLFSDDDICSIDKLPSFSSLSANPDEQLAYPVMSPKIISESKLSPYDSFNQSLPPIPVQLKSKSKLKSKPNLNKKAANHLYAHNLNTNSNNLTYISPSIFIEQSVSHDTIDIPLYISRQNHKQKRTELHVQIPDFGENEINIDICGKYNYKPRNKKK
eukprot:UN02776